MNRDDIAQMMQDTAGANWGTEAHFQRFAAMVAAAEREACYRLARSEAASGAMYGWPECAHEIAKAIRARGEV